MKIFNSIKWRLQLWYGLILVLVLAGFGITAYQLEYNRQMRRIDDELQRRFKIIADALHPRPNQRARPPFDNLPTPEPMPEYHPPITPGFEKFELPPFASIMFGTNQPENFYFVVRRDRKEIARLGNVPEIPPDGIALLPKNYRGWIQNLPSGEIIDVGCSIEPELKELRLTALKLTGIGGIILIFGLAVGNRFVSHAILPINSISDAAAKISAGDLSQRINVTETESELGKLAAVLNSTFARLESAFAQQKQFASDAAHELRTPVSVILTQTQTTLTREREAKDYKETVEACQRAAQRMKRLISALLELTRLDAGQQHIKRKRFDFNETVRESVELIRPITEEHGLKLISELSPIEVTGDSSRLSQVVTNLLTNAIQYNKPHGEIRVTLESKNGLAILTIADTGHGISSIDLPHVFKRFYRGDKSRTGSINAGLGLAICKAIVEAHSGTIEVESREDTGTTFTVRLPV